MKRFVTYLYEYERERKAKNTGFIRVDVRNTEVNMEVCVRNYVRANEVGKICALVKQEGLKGIQLGEVKILNGQGNIRLQFGANDIMGSGFSINDIVGVGICLRNHDYLASCWKDEAAEEIGRGAFSVFNERNDVSVETEAVEEPELKEMEEVVEEPEMEEVEEIVKAAEVAEVAEIAEVEERVDVSYRKIELNQIRTLPSPNWHFCNNSFLAHGFWNYGYLVLKTVVEEDQKKVYLGVPGIFEKPELVMAVFFGFPEFEALPTEMAAEEMDVEKNFSMVEKQEPKIGTFGCWYVELQNI